MFLGFESPYLLVCPSESDLCITYSTRSPNEKEDLTVSLGRENEHLDLGGYRGGHGDVRCGSRSPKRNRGRSGGTYGVCGHGLVCWRWRWTRVWGRVEGGGGRSVWGRTDVLEVEVDGFGSSGSRLQW